jgi:hypothetical protein
MSDLTEALRRQHLAAVGEDQVNMVGPPTDPFGSVAWSSSTRHASISTSREREFVTKEAMMPKTTLLYKVAACDEVGQDYEQLVRARTPCEAARIAHSFFEELGVNVCETTVSPLREPRLDTDDGPLSVGIVYEPAGLDRVYPFKAATNRTKETKSSHGAKHV